MPLTKEDLARNPELRTLVKEAVSNKVRERAPYLNRMEQSLVRDADLFSSLGKAKKREIRKGTVNRREFNRQTTAYKRCLRKIRAEPQRMEEFLERFHKTYPDAWPTTVDKLYSALSRYGLGGRNKGGRSRSQRVENRR